MIFTKQKRSSEEFFDGKKVLITGGAGFIGSHIVEVLSKCCAVTVVDNLSSGKLDNIKALDIDFIEMDIVDTKLENILKDVNIVFHLAAQTSVDNSLEIPLLDANTNILGLINLLECCRRKQVQRIIFSSSSAVYGNNANIPISEDDVCGPESPYGISKKTGEHYMFLYNKLYNMQNVCLRYFNVYGPRQDHDSQYSGVISIFVTRYLNNDVLTIHGDGRQTRDYIHVSDVVKANLLAAQLTKPMERSINIGTGVETSVLDVVNTLDNNYSNIIYSKPRLGDIMRNVAKTNLAREMLQFVPSINIETGIQEYVAWMKFHTN